MGIQIINPVTGGSIDLTAPPTDIGTVTPVAVNSTIFTALPANNTSAFVASGSSLTGSNAQSLVNLSQTWNTTGTPSAILLNITDTASNAASNLMNLQVGGVSKFKITKQNNIILDGSPSITGFNGGSVTIGCPNGNVYLGNTVSFGATMLVGLTGARIRNTDTFEWSSDVTSYGVADVKLWRDASATLAQRNGVNSQTSRLYKSFTDASNYTRAAWQFDANGVLIAGESAGTGDANIDITFTTKGTGNVRFGTHAAVAAEIITGYITIKDSSGTLRKLAVIS